MPVLNTFQIKKDKAKSDNTIGKEAVEFNLDMP